METVKDFFQSVYDSYRDRVKSPFIGSFMISFLIFNWRAFAILFYSEWPIHCRIEWIEEQYCNLKNLLFPIGISFFYVLILPYINLFIEFVLKYYTEKKQQKIDDLETARLLKRKENAKLLRQIADEKAGTSEINNLQTKIESLQKEINDLVEQDKIETKRWNERISASHEKEKQLNKSIDVLNQEKKFLENQITEIKRNISHRDDRDYNNLQDPDFNVRISATIKQLTNNDAKILMRYFKEEELNVSVQLDDSDRTIFKKLQRLNIVEIIDNWATLTNFGNHVFNWLKNDYLES
ncbi:coiled-coil domain-containing protein [Flavobacterium gyeonganense]|uniref:Coiled-coil domain-containing protein n=1 Tax=Flavobacterium gyeonganense TaxID=1310418 RepID=A0ABV5HBC4_9FLAO|nr:hypothetical protein [Flavobacterium gyeonganense]